MNRGSGDPRAGPATAAHGTTQETGYYHTYRGARRSKELREELELDLGIIPISDAIGNNQWQHEYLAVLGAEAAHAGEVQRNAPHIHQPLAKCLANT